MGEETAQKMGQMFADGLIKGFTSLISNPNIILPFLGLTLLIILMNLLLKKKSKPKNPVPNDDKHITYPYTKADLLTPNELNFYKILKPITDKYQLHVIPKVRVADLINVKKEVTGSERQAAFNRTKSKHVDFVIANPRNLDVLCIIELDDSSHNKAAAEKNDTFKNIAFQTIGLPLLRVKSITGIEEQICNTLLIKKIG